MTADDNRIDDGTNDREAIDAQSLTGDSLPVESADAPPPANAETEKDRQPKGRRLVNPFYVVLVLVGVGFVVTACAYGVMAVKQLHAGDQLMPSAPQHEGFVEFMDREGPKVMLIELAILAVATVGAIATDGYWDRS